MIEKVDDRNAAHRNSGSICDKITSHRRPSLGQFTEEEKKMGRNSENFVLDFHGTIGGTFKIL